MLKITTKSQIENRQPEQKQHRITNAHGYYVRPNIAKPHVACCLSHCLSNACLMLFSSSPTLS